MMKLRGKSRALFVLGLVLSIVAFAVGSALMTLGAKQKTPEAATTALHDNVMAKTWSVLSGWGADPSVAGRLPTGPTCKAMQFQVPHARRLAPIGVAVPAKACTEICHGSAANGSTLAYKIKASDTVVPRDYYQCLSCGLVFNARTDANERHEATVSQYLAQVNLPGFGHLVRQLEIGLDCLAPTWRKRWGGKRLLEIGTGLGFFLSTARQAGWSDVRGFELWPAWREFARGHLLLDVQPDFRTAASEIRGTATAVVMLHVVEHLSDPVPMLKSAKEALVPGGVLFIVVPRLFSKRFETAGWAETSASNALHLNHFEPESISSLLQQAGFKTIGWAIQGPTEAEPDLELHTWALNE